MEGWQEPAPKPPASLDEQVANVMTTGVYAPRCIGPDVAAPMHAADDEAAALIHTVLTCWVGRSLHPSLLPCLPRWTSRSCL